MSVEEAFKGLKMGNDDFDLKEVVKVLAELDKNIALKTEIPQPNKLVLLKVLSLYLKQKKLNEPSEILENLIDYLLIYMVSKKRKGREEIIELAKGVMKQKFSDKLLGKQIEP